MTGEDAILNAYFDALTSLVINHILYLNNKVSNFSFENFEHLLSGNEENRNYVMNQQILECINKIKAVIALEGNEGPYTVNCFNSSIYYHLLELNLF